jgi:glycosyltransferase involved in cell wall biosynthesis
LKKIAVVISHPIQYYSPWFRHLTANGFPGLRVFYLWNGSGQLDKGFGVPVKWDVPLLDGYAHEFVPNRSAHPGSATIRGLNNPELNSRMEALAPDAILMFGYNYLTHYRLLFSRIARKVPLLFRGDSHRIFTRHSPLSTLRSPLKKIWISRVFARFAAFLPVGAANRDYFLHHGVPPRKMFHCPHCVDNNRFFAESEKVVESARQWRSELGIAAKQRVILFAGKFESKKRPRDLLEAFRQSKLEGVSLLMVGNGELESELRQSSPRCQMFTSRRFRISRSCRELT